MTSPLSKVELAAVAFVKSNGIEESSRALDALDVAIAALLAEREKGKKARKPRDFWSTVKDPNVEGGTYPKPKKGGRS